MTNRIARNIEQLGWLNTGLYALDRLLARLSGGAWRLHKYHFVAQAVQAAPLCGGRGKQIDVRLCRRQRDLPPDYPRPAFVLRQRHAQGAHSLAALRDGRLVGFLWLLSGAYQEDEVRARYTLAAGGSAWDFDVWVLPEERFGLVFARLWDAAGELLRARGARWTCSRISAFNPDSLNAHARIGTVSLGAALFLCCGRWQWMAATRAPYFHLSRHPASFPRFAFDTRGLDHPPSMESPCSILKK